MIGWDFPSWRVPAPPPWLRMRQNDTVIDPRIVATRNVAFGIIAPILIGVGMLGNLLTIFLLRQPQFKGVTYTYFLVLAVSDLLSLFFSISLVVHLVRVATYAFSTAVWYSYFELLFINWPMSASVLIVVCVTVDRFFSVCRPKDFKSIHTPRQARKGILGAVAIALVLWLPTCVLKQPKLHDDCESTNYFIPPEDSDNKTWWVSCMVEDTFDHPWYLVYSWIRQIILTFIPTIVLVTMNTMIVREYMRVSKKRRELGGNQANLEERRKEDKNLINLLTAVMVSFFITMVPGGIFNAIYTEFLSTEFEYELFRAIANNLEILNHALNFYIYILCSKPIRLATRNYLERCHLYVVNSRVYSVVAALKQVIRKDDDVHSVTPTLPHNPRLQDQSQHRSDSGHQRKNKTLSRETEPSECQPSTSDDESTTTSEEMDMANSRRKGTLVKINIPESQPSENVESERIFTTQPPRRSVEVAMAEVHCEEDITSPNNQCHCEGVTSSNNQCHCEGVISPNNQYGVEMCHINPSFQCDEEPVNYQGKSPMKNDGGTPDSVNGNVIVVKRFPPVWV